MSPECAICGSGISPFQTTKDIRFREQPMTVHYRCWFENQDALRQLEQQESAHAPLAELMRKLRAENFKHRTEDEL